VTCLICKPWVQIPVPPPKKEKLKEFTSAKCYDWIMKIVHEKNMLIWHSRIPGITKVLFVIIKIKTACIQSPE
jgi:hypothetical protein